MTFPEICTKCAGTVRMYETGTGAMAGTCPSCGHYQCIEIRPHTIHDLGPLNGVYVEWPVTEDTGRRICRTASVRFDRLDRFIANLHKNGITDWFFGPMIHRLHRRCSE